MSIVLNLGRIVGLCLLLFSSGGVALAGFLFMTMFIEEILDRVQLRLAVPWRYAFLVFGCIAAILGGGAAVVWSVVHLA